MVATFESVKLVLDKQAPPDLAAHYRRGMEAFVEVKKAKPVYDAEDRLRPNTYEDDGFITHGFRSQTAGDDDKPLSYPLTYFYNQIGLSGWNYLEGVADWVAYDLDHIAGHPGVGLTTERLTKARLALESLPYVEIRRSTGGIGLHAYVRFADPPKIKDRLEMKALARAVLAKMSFDSGFDFTSSVDHLGDILWVCARRAKDCNGLTLIKSGEPLADYPRDFLDHLVVVSGKRTRTRFKASEGEADAIDEDAANQPRVPLEESHRTFFKNYSATDFAGWWDEDRHCFVGHTAALEKMGLPGIYKTVSAGNHPDTPNAWMYPLAGGGWRVFRFGKGTPEANTWSVSPNGWTTCVIGQTPAPHQVAIKFGGIRNGKGFTYKDAEGIVSAVKAYGVKLIPPEWKPRPYTLEVTRDGLVISCPCKNADDEDALAESGWFKVRGPKWQTTLEHKIELPPVDYGRSLDNLVRHVCRGGKQEGLYVCTKTQGWQKTSMDQTKNRLAGAGVPSVKLALSYACDYAWARVALPFQPIEPGNRLWNLDGCQLTVQPSNQPGLTPTWDEEFQHWGQGLDDAICPWCKAHGIESGADYLRCWLASMLRYPERHLPMLAMYSAENNTAKSFMHESFRLALTLNGYMLSDKAIKNRGGFDAELHGVVLAALDDIDMSGDVTFYNSLKRWITNDWMNYGYKGEEVFLDRNYTHWIHTAQYPGHIPLDANDERITIWEMTPFGKTIVSKVDMTEKLTKELPALLHQLWRLDLSEMHSRLAIPALWTPEKLAATKTEGEPTLEGPAGKIAEAIEKMKKPWGPGTATDLHRQLADWHGTDKPEKSCVNSLGRYLPRVRKLLAPRGIAIEIRSGHVTTYDISVIAT